MRNRNRTTPVLFLAILLSSCALAVMTADEFYVAVPGLTCVIMVLWLWLILWDRDQKIPFFDVGVICALATLVYTVYPLVNYWVNGLQFGFLSDNRLQQYRVLPKELGFFHLRHVFYLFSFVVSYAVFRGRGPIEVSNVSIPRRSVRQAIFLYFLLLTGYFYFLQIMTSVNVNASYEQETYSNNLIALNSLPLIVLQITGKLAGILFFFKLAVLFIVVSRCRQKKWYAILLIWIAAEIIQTFILKGSRSGMVLFLIAAALLYHRMIKPLSMKFLITSGTMLLLLFIFLGLYRSYIDFVSMQLDLSQTYGGILSGSNEFQSLLGTAYDVFQRKTEGAYLPWYLYLNDFITILPPQQLMPFEKVGASEWYLREIGISGIGQGYMWGVISQSIVGLDWLELFFRGALLGYILARFHRWYLKHQSGFLETLLYTFFCIKVYYTFRDTTLYPLSDLVWVIIPSYILLRIGEANLPRKIGDQRRNSMAIPHHNIK